MIKLRLASDAMVSVRDLLGDLGEIPPERVRLRPPLGTATEKHVVLVHDQENRLCELVNGVLVEKAMGSIESLLAGVLVFEIQRFIEDADLGVVLGGTRRSSRCVARRESLVECTFATSGTHRALALPRDADIGTSTSNCQ